MDDDLKSVNTGQSLKKTIKTRASTSCHKTIEIMNPSSPNKTSKWPINLTPLAVGGKIHKFMWNRRIHRPTDGRTARNHYCDGIHTNNWPVNMSGRRLCHVYYSRAGPDDFMCCLRKYFSWIELEWKRIRMGVYGSCINYDTCRYFM